MCKRDRKYFCKDHKTVLCMTCYTALHLECWIYEITDKKHVQECINYIRNLLNTSISNIVIKSKLSILTQCLEIPVHLIFNSILYYIYYPSVKLILIRVGYLKFSLNLVKILFHKILVFSRLKDNFERSDLKIKVNNMPRTKVKWFDKRCAL